MTPLVTVVDYGMGNLFSVGRALEHCGARVHFAETPEAVREAERVILPGVGAFPDGMQELKRHGFDTAIREFAAGGKPLLGICLGMQMLLDESEEFGTHAGLGLIRGRVTPIPATGSDGKPHKIPHIGWNRLVPAASWEGTILGGVPQGESVYFVHSFAAFPEDPNGRLADCDYNGRSIPAVIHESNVTGCQFHPEKSGPTGLRMLKNFISLRLDD